MWITWTSKGYHYKHKMFMWFSMGIMSLWLGPICMLTWKFWNYKYFEQLHLGGIAIIMAHLIKMKSSNKLDVVMFPRRFLFYFQKGVGVRFLMVLLQGRDFTRSLSACYEGSFNEISLFSSWHLTWSKKWNLISTNVFTSAIFHSMLLIF